MIGDNARKIIANMSKNVHVTRTIPISLYADPVHEIDVIKGTPGAYLSNLQFTIRYAENEVISNKKGKPFLLKIDLFDTIEKCGHRVASFEDLLAEEKFKPFLPFLLEYTNLGPDLFELAQANPTLDLPIAFDVLKYVREANQKFIAQELKKAESGEISFYTFMSEIGIKINELEEQEKVIHKTNSRDRVYKGVVEK